MPPKRVLVRTLNLFNGNYGGILQAYALQRTLGALGYEGWTDSSFPASPLGHARQALVRRLPPAAVPARVRPESMARGDNRLLHGFVRSHIRVHNIYRFAREPERSRTRGFDAFIVGSDQIWRPDYGDIASFLLDFLRDEQPLRIAYAASFGASTLEGFSDDVLERTRGLARKFDAISVREGSGIGLCRSAWNVPAVRVLDPTLLLTVDHYRSLAKTAAAGESAPTLYRYVLDDSDEKRRMTSCAASDQALQVVEAGVATGGGLSRRPTVEEWLAGFAEATTVFTDSFHGMVFSILFNKPFVAVVNDERGADRFTSLAETLGLSPALMRLGEDWSAVHAPDWADVNAVVQQERDRSVEFLATSLGAR